MFLFLQERGWREEGSKERFLFFLHREREREGLFLGFLKEDEEKRKEERKEKFLHHFKDEAPSRKFV